MTEIRVGCELALADLLGAAEIHVGSEYALADVLGDAALQIGAVFALVDAEIMDPALIAAAVQRANQPVREKIVATPMSPRTAAPSTLS